MRLLSGNNYLSKVKELTLTIHYTWVSITYQIGCNDSFLPRPLSLVTIAKPLTNLANHIIPPHYSKYTFYSWLCDESVNTYTIKKQCSN